MKTHELLNITEEQYEDKIFKHWFKYCELHSADTQEFQSLLANAALNRWWLNNLRLLEDEFRFEAEPYIKDEHSTGNLQHLWFKNAIKLQLYYSMPLLKNKLITIHGNRN